MLRLRGDLERRNGDFARGAGDLLLFGFAFLFFIGVFRGRRALRGLREKFSLS